jgi:hypothetical protein
MIFCLQTWNAIQGCRRFLVLILINLFLIGDIAAAPPGWWLQPGAIQSEFQRGEMVHLTQFENEMRSEIDSSAAAISQNVAQLQIGAISMEEFYSRYPSQDHGRADYVRAIKIQDQQMSIREFASEEIQKASVRIGQIALENHQFLPATIAFHRALTFGTNSKSNSKLLNTDALLGLLQTFMAIPEDLDTPFLRIVSTTRFEASWQEKIELYAKEHLVPGSLPFKLLFEAKDQLHRMLKARSIQFLDNRDLPHALSNAIEALLIKSSDVQTLLLVYRVGRFARTRVTANWLMSEASLVLSQECDYLLGGGKSTGAANR